MMTWLGPNYRGGWISASRTVELDGWFAAEAGRQGEGKNRSYRNLEKKRWFSQAYPSPSNESLRASSSLVWYHLIYLFDIKPVPLFCNICRIGRVCEVDILLGLAKFPLRLSYSFMWPSNEHECHFHLNCRWLSSVGQNQPFALWMLYGWLPIIYREYSSDSILACDLLTAPSIPSFLFASVFGTA